MRPQSLNLADISSGLSAAPALRGGAIHGSGDGPPPGVGATGTPGRNEDLHSISSAGPGVDNDATQRSSGITCVCRQAGGRRPAPSTSSGPVPRLSKGSRRRPDAHARAGRAGARLFGLPVLALLLGGLSLFAAAPAQAQTQGAPGKTVLRPVESGTNAPTATTLSFTIKCATAGYGRPITDYHVRAVAQGVASLERTYFFPDK